MRDNLKKARPSVMTAWLFSQQRMYQAIRIHDSSMEALAMTLILEI